MLLDQTLYIVATPIGHRDDLSARAIEVLQRVDQVYAEDTRHSMSLLTYHGVHARLSALHEHNEQSRTESIVKDLLAGRNAALISDAGTPLINDPGYRLVQACQLAGIRVSPVPGACAVTAALSVSGLPTDRFEFAGFAPARGPARQRFFSALAKRSHTLVLYESPHRIVASLRDMTTVFGEQRLICLARELTKRFETVMHGRCGDVLERLLADPQQQKGEFVVVIGGWIQTTDEPGLVAVELDRTLLSLLQHLPIKTAAKCAADIHQITKKQAYDRALVIQNKT